MEKEVLIFSGSNENQFWLLLDIIFADSVEDLWQDRSKIIKAPQLLA